jgi:phosphoribosylformimino-5-aminoimidazole carboxamide ribotide isomerase
LDVIPVLDLKGGRALHARRGDRAAYAVVRGALGDGADPVALARAFRDRLGCRHLYLADLDALTDPRAARPAAASAAALAALAALGLELWVDAGVRDASEAAALQAAGAARVVVALETLPGLEALGAIVRRPGSAGTAFSLDLRAGRPLAADPNLAAASPEQIARAVARSGCDTLIVLDLARVGSDTGPPLTLLRRLRAALPTLPLVAGGGVRHAGDLEALARLGCAAALVASAIHAGRITRSDIDRLGSPA